MATTAGRSRRRILGRPDDVEPDAGELRLDRGEGARRSLGIHAETLYPPVVAGAPPLPWADRRRGFVAMGRISPEKEYERIIRILARVKRTSPISRSPSSGRSTSATRAYMQRLTTLVTSLGAGEWVSFRHDLPRDEVRALIAATRYGIHGMREEHFGMAPAEMVRGGMIVWVPNGGGQVEIVGDAPALRYDSEEQAAEQILSVIDNPREEHACAITSRITASGSASSDSWQRFDRTSRLSLNSTTVPTANYM